MARESCQLISKKNAWEGFEPATSSLHGWTPDNICLFMSTHYVVNEKHFSATNVRVHVHVHAALDRVIGWYGYQLSCLHISVPLLGCYVGSSSPT